MNLPGSKSLEESCIIQTNLLLSMEIHKSSFIIHHSVQCPDSKCGSSIMHFAGHFATIEASVGGFS